MVGDAGQFGNSAARPIFWISAHYLTDRYRPRDDLPKKNARPKKKPDGRKMKEPSS